MKQVTDLYHATQQKYRNFMKALVIQYPPTPKHIANGKLKYSLI